MRTRANQGTKDQNLPIGRAVFQFVTQARNGDRAIACDFVKGKGGPHWLDLICAKGRVKRGYRRNCVGAEAGKNSHAVCAQINVGRGKAGDERGQRFFGGSLSDGCDRNRKISVLFGANKEFWKCTDGFVRPFGKCFGGGEDFDLILRIEQLGKLLDARRKARADRFQRFVFVAEFQRDQGKANCNAPATAEVGGIPTFMMEKLVAFFVIAFEAEGGGAEFEFAFFETVALSNPWEDGVRKGGDENGEEEGGEQRTEKAAAALDRGTRLFQAGLHSVIGFN